MKRSVKARYDGTLYALDDPSLPSGPRGADPGAMAAFGTGAVDLDRLGALLMGRGPDEEQKLFAESRHRAIAEVLNLPPAALTEAFRHAKVSDFPGAVLVDPGVDLAVS